MANFKYFNEGTESKATCECGATMDAIDTANHKCPISINYNANPTGEPRTTTATSASSADAPPEEV